MIVILLKWVMITPKFIQQVIIHYPKKGVDRSDMAKM